MTVTTQNYTHEEAKGKLNLGNSCYHSVQNLLSSHTFSKNVTIEIYKTIILSFLLYGREIWSLTLKEERRLKVSEKMVLRRIFRPNREEVTRSLRKSHSKELHISYSSPDIIRVIT
jgi:hypothetical protein